MTQLFVDFIYHLGDWYCLLLIFYHVWYVNTHDMFRSIDPGRAQKMQSIFSCTYSIHAVTRLVCWSAHIHSRAMLIQAWPAGQACNSSASISCRDWCSLYTCEHLCQWFVYDGDMYTSHFPTESVSTCVGMGHCLWWWHVYSTLSHSICQHLLGDKHPACFPTTSNMTHRVKGWKTPYWYPAHYITKLGYTN